MLVSPFHKHTSQHYMTRQTYQHTEVKESKWKNSNSKPWCDKHDCRQAEYNLSCAHQEEIEGFVQFNIDGI